MSSLRAARTPLSVTSQLVPIVVVSVAVAGLTVMRPSVAGLAMAVLSLTGIAVACALARPAVAIFFVLVASFLRAATAGIVPGAEPYVLTLLLAIAATAIAVSQRRIAGLRPGRLEMAMFGYLAWNLLSWGMPHHYAAVGVDGAGFSVWRYLLAGTIFPFVLFVLSKLAFRDTQDLDRLFGVVVGLAAYSCLVSTLQFHGPRALVWPRYIIDRPGWHDRAVGVFNQPVTNGLILVVGFVACLVLAQRSRSGVARCGCYVVAAWSVYSIYLTHTRAVWLGFVLTLVLLAILNPGLQRRVSLSILSGAALSIAAEWGNFRGSNRAAGGVGSTSEIYDRLNDLTTSIWAWSHKPVLGWGIGRFSTVNTDHHRQWAPSVDWARGYATVAHENELGIAVELGVIGLALWLTVLVMVVRRVSSAQRAVGPIDAPTRAAATVAASGLLTYIVIGTTVDLRFLDFANGLVFVLAGAAVGIHERRRTTVDATG